MTFLFVVLKSFKSSYLFNFIREFYLFRFKAMTNKRNTKANDEETDRSCRESSSDGSVLENPINNGAKTGRTRRCKAAASNKTANALKIKRTPKSKRLSESSCDSVAKEVSESNLTKVDEDIAPNYESSTISQQPADPIDNEPQEAMVEDKGDQTTLNMAEDNGDQTKLNMAEDKGDQSKLNSDKYSKLLSILGGEEGDIDNFIKQFAIWQQSQSNTNKQTKNKKNVTKSQTLQKPMKAKVNNGTPTIKLIKKTSSKKLSKDSYIKRSLTNQDDSKEPDTSISENKINNTDSSNSLVFENTNTKKKNGDPHESIGHSSDTKTEDEPSKDTSDRGKDVKTDLELDSVQSKEKMKIPRGNSNGIKHGKKKIKELSKVDTTDCLSPVIACDVVLKDIIEQPIESEIENISHKEIKVSSMEDPFITSEITSKEVDKIPKFVPEGKEENLENKEINNDIVDSEKKGLVHQDKVSEICVSDSILEFSYCDNNKEKNKGNSKNNFVHKSLEHCKENYDVNLSILQSNNLDIDDSILEIVSDDKTIQSGTDTNLDSLFDGTVPNLVKSKSSSLTSLSNIDIEESKHSYKENKDDKVDTSAILNVNNSPLIEQEQEETDIVWKRKRRLSDDSQESTKRSKRVTKIDEPQHDITSLEYNNKWNNDESNSFFEELIYSDEEKVHNYTDDDISLKVFKSGNDQQKDKLKTITSKFDLGKKVIEKSNCSHHKDITFDDNAILYKKSTHAETTNTSDRKVHKEKKCSNDIVSSSSRKSKHHSNEKDKINKISSKSKKHMKSKTRLKSKKSSLECRVNVEDLQLKGEVDNSYESMLKKVKKQLKNGHRSILETDLPVVEVSYKGELLHGILGSVDSLDFLTRFKMNKEKLSNENILSTSYAQDVLKKCLKLLCYKMIREGSCKDPQNCRKEHKVPNDFFSNMDKQDAWLIVAFILNISNCLSENLLTAILEFLTKHKAKRKILLVSRHIFQSQQNSFPVLKTYWEDVLLALECCGFQRWEGIRFVFQFITDTHSPLKPEIFLQLLKIWNVHGSSLSNTWQIVEPLVTKKIIILPPLILSKLLGEIIAVEPKDKLNIYKLLVQQLTSLTKENFNQISYQLLNDFLRRISQEGLHGEEKTLREIMNSSYYSPFFPKQSPPNSSLRRCRSMINLTSASSESKFHLNAVVHEEEKMEAAMQRALQCSNYDSVIKVIIASHKKVFINKVLLAVFKYAMDKNSYIILKNIFVKINSSFTQYVDEIKDLIGNIVVTMMLDYVKQYNWKEANNYFNLLEEYHVNKYKLKSLTDLNLRPVRLAVVYSEIHYYNGRYKESIGVFISTRILDPDSSQWAVPGGNNDDFKIISVMIVFLLNELLNKKIVNIATMLFKAVFEAQGSLSEPIVIGHFFEALLYKLFEMTEEYPETAVKLYMRVIAKDSNVTLYGLTYRALIILAYRTHKRAIIKDIFYKAINEYVYPIIEENENVIMLLRSHTEEEIIVYILEWVARFKEKQPDSCEHQIQIKFKDAVLEDYLDNKVLGIPALLKEVDQTLPGAFKRLDSVLKRLHIKFKQIKKDTFSIDPMSFQNFLKKIKLY